MPPTSKSEAERLVKVWLKNCAETAGYRVQGAPSLEPPAGGQSGPFGLAVNYLATVTIVMDSNIAADITEQMKNIPIGKDDLRAEGRSENILTLKFRLGVEG